jgi:glycosyltransferase involved in cell wall biosynthesis
MSFYYGDAGKSVANDLVQGKTIPDWETKIMEYPFFEKAIAGALGVICHSDFLADKIRPRTLAPVAKLHFPVENVSSIREAKIDKDTWGIPHDKTVLLTMGNVNRNKRIDRIIEILGKQRSLREKVVYIIIGAYDHNPDFHKYTDLIAKYNLDETVRFLGYQPDTVLSSFMSSADIFVNMRFPVMEGGSASLAEQMLYKKPIIVTNAGHYSELPDDCVVKIDVEQEASHLVKALTKLISDKELRLRIGDRAATYVKDHCSVHRYGDEINEFLIQSIQLRPCLRLVDRISDELANMKISRELPVVDIVSQEISIIFS